MNQARMAAQQRSNRRSSRGISPGRSMAQFGHAGHAGKSQSKAQKHQRAGINTPNRGPGSNRNLGQTPSKQTATVSTPKKTATVSTPKKTKFKDKLISGVRTLGELKHIRDIITGNWPGVIKNIGTAYGANKMGIPIGYDQGIGNLWTNPNFIYNETTGEFEDKLGNVVPKTMPGATQAKTFNTAQELMNLGAAEKGWFGPGLTKQGKSLDQFIEDAKLRQKAGKEQTGQAFYDWATDKTRSGLYKGWKKHAPYIEGALKQGVLSETSDYSGQLPFKKGIDLANGGIVNLFKYGGFLG
jgi:hypothetical protein